MTPVYVHTLGDSTLDNLFWLLREKNNNIDEAKAASVEGQLEKSLNEGGAQRYEVVSHAYDGFTTSSMFGGDDVGRVLQMYPKYVSHPTSIAYLQGKGVNPTSESFKVLPLEVLNKSIERHPEAIHYVVISVGGNDFRERLLNPLAMIKEIPSIHRRYLLIVQYIKESNRSRDIRPILMFQYRTDANHDPYYIYPILKGIGGLAAATHILGIAGIAKAVVSLMKGKASRIWSVALGAISALALILSSKVIPLKVTASILKGQSLGVSALGGLMETFYRPILAQAKEEGIPILDLPNTFNPYEQLYISGIEPSAEGGKRIAEGLAHIVKQHDFSGPSLIYSKEGSITSCGENPGSSGWQVKYPSHNG